VYESKYSQGSRDPNYRKNEKARMAADRVVESGRLLLILIGCTAGLLLVDGWRRDYGNLSAVLVARKGDVRASVRKDNKTVELNPGMGSKLDAGTTINCGPDGSATLAFPDGTALQLDSGASMTIRVLDFFRSGRRDRSFEVTGPLIVRHSSHAGPHSQLTVTTGDTIVVGKPGSTFRVDLQKTTTRVEVLSGAAVMRTAALRRDVRPGQQFASDGSLSTIPDNRALKQLSASLAKYDVKPNFWTDTASGATRFLDPLLQKIGITLQGWNPDKTDLTRRDAAFTSLKKLATLIGVGDAPESLNPVTLAELGSPNETERLKKDFTSLVIDGYQKSGSGYTLRVRARDSKGTPLELKNGKITVGK
jgi:ferric-dicitrate binding protein FerR (iron transport regulator)